MPRDHYIAQTYLKHFGDNTCGGMLHAYRKSDGAEFSCWPKDICHEWDGDLNPAFFVERLEVLGDFRKIFEPHWDSSVESIVSGTLSYSEKFIISGYVANLMTCTPTGKRLGVEMYNRQLAGYLSFSKKMKKKHGGMPDLPVEAIEMMERGEITIHTDPNYIKAITTKHLLDHAWRIYNQDWTILANDTDHPFITSDNPVALMHTPSLRRPPTRILPITPRICLSVDLSIRVPELNHQKPMADFEKPPIGNIIASHVVTGDAKHINRIVVQCAEDLVFSSVKSAGVQALVKKYAKHRLMVDYVALPTGEENSIYQGTIVRVREVTA